MRRSPENLTTWGQVTWGLFSTTGDTVSRMPMLTLDTETLKTWLPHRGVNLIPDLITLSPDRRSSTSSTQVMSKDVRGRELMARTDGQGRSVWQEAFLVELMALTGIPIVSEQLAAQGQVAVFSMISKVEVHSSAPIRSAITGHARIERERGGFTTFSAIAEVEGRKVLTVEIMSGAAVMSEIASFPVRPFHGQLPTVAEVGPFAWKPAPLRFVERIMHEEPQERKLACSYVYPPMHPFVPGHFPGAPLMMGVTQWTAVADAAWIAAQRFGLAGGPVLVNGGVKRQDGSDVLDVRDLRIEPDGAGYRITATRRVAFREPVRPGDGLIVEVQISPA